MSDTTRCWTASRVFFVLNSTITWLCRLGNFAFSPLALNFGAPVSLAIRTRSGRQSISAGSGSLSGYISAIIYSRRCATWISIDSSATALQFFKQLSLLMLLTKWCPSYSWLAHSYSIIHKQWLIYIYIYLYIYTFIYLFICMYKWMIYLKCRYKFGSSRFGPVPFLSFFFFSCFVFVFVFVSFSFSLFSLPLFRPHF